MRQNISPMDPRLKNYISDQIDARVREVRDELNTKLRGIERKIRELIEELSAEITDERITKLREEIVGKLRLIEHRLNENIDAAVDEQNNKQLSIVRDDIKREVGAIVKSKIGPEIKKCMDYIKYRVGEDDSELVTKYRHGVMGSSGQTNMGLLRGAPAQSRQPRQSRQEFTASTFAFNDYD